jgi:hypothetical protein
MLKMQKGCFVPSNAKTFLKPTSVFKCTTHMKAWGAGGPQFIERIFCSKVNLWLFQLNDP